MSLRSVVANVLDFKIVVSEFEFQSLYYVYFRINILEKGMNPDPPAIDLKTQLLFFYKDGFGIKYPTNVDMPLNKETERNQT